MEPVPQNMEPTPQEDSRVPSSEIQVNATAEADTGRRQVDLDKGFIGAVVGEGLSRISLILAARTLRKQLREYESSPEVTTALEKMRENGDSLSLGDSYQADFTEKSKRSGRTYQGEGQAVTVLSPSERIDGFGTIRSATLKRVGLFKASQTTEHSLTSGVLPLRGMMELVNQGITFEDIAQKVADYNEA